MTVGRGLPMIRLGELRPVLDANKLTKGLRGGLVGGRKQTARLRPVEGGLTVEIYGSATFVPWASGSLPQELAVDPSMLAGFITKTTKSFHPAELVTFDLGADRLRLVCGTLEATFKLL
ncbi:MAG: hypothetical protein ACLGIE_15875 [Alphaproteobacteria bacterium]